MKSLLTAVGVMMLVVGGLVTARAYGWIGVPTQSSIQAIGGPLMAGLGIALVWSTFSGGAS